MACTSAASIWSNPHLYGRPLYVYRLFFPLFQKSAFTLKLCPVICMELLDRVFIYTQLL